MSSMLIDCKDVNERYRKKPPIRSSSYGIMSFDTAPQFS